MMNNYYFDLKKSIDDHYQIREQNLYLRSDVSGPLDLSSNANLDQQQIYYAAAAQTKLGHMLMNNYSQMQMPPPYPISYNPAQTGSEESKQIHQIEKFSNYQATSSTIPAVSTYLSQLNQDRPTVLPQQANVASASSYYTLTPASSTASLNDFALLSNSIQNQPIQRKCTLSRTDSKKRARTTTSETSSENDTTTANLRKTTAAAKAQAAATATANATNGPAAVPRRRGRPPKNAAVSQSTSQLPVATEPPKAKATTEEVKEPMPNQKEAQANDVQPTKKSEAVTRAKASNLVRSNSSIDSSNTSKFAKSNNKLIKSLINKSSSNSNLQKSKVQTTEMSKSTNENSKPTDSEPAPVQPTLINKANNVLSNVNTNSQQQQQSQITGYLVDKINTSIMTTNNALNNQDYIALKTAGVNVISKSNSENTQLNPTNQTIYTGYYNKVKSIRSSADVSLVTPTEEYSSKPEQLDTTPMPKLSWANNHELWETMRKKDAKYVHDPFYLKRHCGIEPQMRAILLDWLVEISYAYRLHRETFHLAMEYMDRFMTCSKQQMRVDRLQLIGMTCLFLAAKVEEIYPPKLKELASHMENYSNNNEDAISQFELFILKTLNWEISPVTANTWLMTYVQIASLNYYSIMNNSAPNDQPLNSHMVMPLNIYKNSNANRLNATQQQQQFYIKNYMKSVTLLDLCMFEMDSMRFSYSVLAASALYHMLCYNPSQAQDQYTTPLNQQGNQQALAVKVVELSTGYKLYELDACIKWMFPFADICKDILTEEKMTFVKSFSSVEQEDSHNIQLYHQNLELLKEAQSRKTPCKFYSNQNVAPIILTPPDSHRKYATQSNNDNTLLMYTPAATDCTNSH